MPRNPLFYVVFSGFLIRWSLVRSQPGAPLTSLINKGIEAETETPNRQGEY